MYLNQNAPHNRAGLQVRGGNLQSTYQNPERHMLYHNDITRKLNSGCDKEFLKNYYANVFQQICNKNPNYGPQQNLIFGPNPVLIISSENTLNVERMKKFQARPEPQVKVVKKKSTKPSSKIPFAGIYNNKKYKYIVTQGNNSKLIREAMRRRPWWVEIPNFNSVFNFKWQPTSHRMKFRELGKGRAIKQMVNHLEFHKYLSEKSELLN